MIDLTGIGIRYTLSLTRKVMMRIVRARGIYSGVIGSQLYSRGYVNRG
jgi:hypothetical protein